MKKNYMIKKLTTFLLLIFILQCNDGSNHTKANNEISEGIKYTVGMTIPVGNQRNKPDWVNMEGGIITLDGDKYLWVKGEGNSKNEKIAKRSAEADATGRIADSIALIIANQFAQAWESIGIDDAEEIEQVKTGLTATKSEVNIQGLRLIKTYKQQVATIQSLDKEDEPKLGSVQWKYVVMLVIPYDKYIYLRDNFVDKVKKNATTQQKKLLDKAENILKTMDTNPNELNVKN